MNVAATILETEYVPSKLNVVCDGLSRGRPPSELGLDESLWVHLPETGPVVQYIRECDPRLPLITWAQVTDHMGLCHQLLSRTVVWTVVWTVVLIGTHRTASSRGGG